MKYGEVLGPMTGKYRGWFDLISVDRPPGSRIQHQPEPDPNRTLILQKWSDSASPILFQNCATGKSVNVVIDFVKPDALKTVHMRFELEDTHIASISVVPAENGRATEELILVCTSLTVTSSFAP